MTSDTLNESELPRGPGATLARWMLRVAGWKLEGGLPDCPRAVVLGAPHTTNWDLAILLLASAAVGLRLRWVGKASLFRPPLGALLRRVGGIPVERGTRSGAVQALVHRMLSEPAFMLCISPEGTRSYVDHWRSGFYRIARATNVPVILGFVDYARKIVGLGPAMHLTGDVDADMATIAAFYSDKRGRHPENEGVVRFLPDEMRE